jgi:hypothetical protein
MDKKYNDVLDNKRILDELIEELRIRREINLFEEKEGESPTLKQAEKLFSLPIVGFGHKGFVEEKLDSIDGVASKRPKLKKSMTIGDMSPNDMDIPMKDQMFADYIKDEKTKIKPFALGHSMSKPLHPMSNL